MAAAPSTQPDKTIDGTMTSRQTVRPVVRRRDLELYPAAVHPPPPLQPSPARVTFQPSHEDKDNKSGTTRRPKVRDPVLTDDTWSWDDEDEESAKDRMRGTAADDKVFKNSSNWRSEPVPTMPQRLYGDDNQAVHNANRFRAPHSDERWWDRYSDHYLNRNEYSDMVDEWKRRAFRFLPNSSCSCLLNDGDEVVRLDGQEGSGTLLYDLASCRQPNRLALPCISILFWTFHTVCLQ